MLTGLKLGLIFSMICLAVKSQTNKQKLIHVFDKVEYYSDSTIKCVYSLNHKKHHGYSIEFNANGQPNYIGLYYKGKKWKWWIKPDNNCGHYSYYGNIDYSDGQPNDIDFSCITGKPGDFSALYNRLINGQTSLHL